MANRKRTNPVQFYLDDDEQYILDEKFRVSGMKSKSAFLRKLILYGYVYDVLHIKNPPAINSRTYTNNSIILPVGKNIIIVIPRKANNI